MLCSHIVSTCTASLAGAVEMIKFSMVVCEIQGTSDLFFMFEQPQSSRAWDLESVAAMAARDGVAKARFRRCMYGLEARDHLGSAPAYKPTAVLTNHDALSEVLRNNCPGGHLHVQLVGKHAC